MAGAVSADRISTLDRRHHTVAEHLSGHGASLARCETGAESTTCIWSQSGLHMESIRIARVMPSRHRNQPRFTQVVAPEDSAGVEHYSPVDEVGHPFDNPT